MKNVLQFFSKISFLDKDFKKHFPELLFKLAIFLSLFGYSFDGQISSDGSFIRQLTWSIFGFFAFVHVFFDFIRTGKSNFRYGGWIIWLIVFYSLASTLWSVTPSATIKRSILLLIVLMLAISCFGKQNDNFNFAKILGAPLFIIVALSIIAAVVAPNLAITGIGWRGITSHKNELGQAIAILLLIFIYGNQYKSIKVFWRWIFIIIFIVVLNFTKSSTSLLSLLVAVIVTSGINFFVFAKQNKKLIHMYIFLFSIPLLIFHVTFIFDVLPTMREVNKLILVGLGKSETLTGRTDLWQLVLNESLYHNSLFGGGYGGFWVGPNSVSAYTANRNGIYLGQAHNGYIDLYNEIGWIGLALTLLLICKLILNVFKMIMRGSQEWKLCFSILVVILVANYAESTLIRNTQFLNITLFATVVYAQRLVAPRLINIK